MLSEVRPEVRTYSCSCASACSSFAFIWLRCAVRRSAVRWNVFNVHRPKGVAVARNEEVVPRSRWGDTVAAEGDRFEILTAAQGG